MTKEKILKWLHNHPALKMDVIEREVGIPQSTLSRWKSGDRDLPDNHIEPLIKELKKYGLK